LELELAGKQRLLLDTVEHNEGLADVVYDLNVQLATREHVKLQSSTSGTGTTNNTTSVNSANPMQEHPLKQERDHTLIQAGELSMKLADTRATEDELRDELEDALANIKQHYKQQNQNPYNNVGNNYNHKYPAPHGHAHVPTAPQSQLHSPSHAATYHAVAPDYKTTINNNNYNSTDSPFRSFMWPGRHQAVQFPKQNSPPSSPPIPAWMTVIFDQTESTEDESDSERSGSLPVHVTVHKKTTSTNMMDSNASMDMDTNASMDMDTNASMDMDTNEMLPLEDFADVELTDAMDGFAL
jgi:hypothetical protein